MEQIKKFLHGKGFALLLTASLLAAAAAGGWAVRALRAEQQGRCAAADALWGILWCAVWLWFAARTLGTARRILACQQFGTACRRALYAGARAQRLQRR